MSQQQQVASYFLRILAFLAVLIGFVFVYRAMLRMNADSLYYVNLVAQFTLIIMGVLLALRDAWVRQHPNVVLIAFVLVGALAMFAAIRQGQENTKETNEANQRAESAQKQVISISTGGDSSCYVKFLFRESHARMIVLQRGAFPLMEVTVTIINSDDDKWPWQVAPTSIGTLPLRGTRYVGTIIMPDLPEVKYVASFTARNGAWDQLILLRHNESGWHFATRVMSNPGQVDFASLDKSFIPMYDVIDKGFPGDPNDSWQKFNGYGVYCTDCK